MSTKHDPDSAHGRVLHKHNKLRRHLHESRPLPVDRVTPKDATVHNNAAQSERRQA